jgi:hypothetical protein
VSAQPTCPAATIEHPIQGDVARCGIGGQVQMAEFEGTKAVCCSDYTRCAIWRGEKERLWINRRSARTNTNVRTDGSGQWEAA